MEIRTLRSGVDEQFETRKLVMEGFSKKFSQVKLNSEQLLELTELVWRFPREPSPNKQYVTEIDGEIVGTMSLLRDSTADETDISLSQLGRRFGFLNVIRLLTCYSVLGHKLLPGEVYIDHLVSLPTMRGKGIGTHLLETAKQTLKKGERLTLYVAESNSEALKLYERLGFTIVEKKTSYLRKRLVGEAGWCFMAWQPNEK